MQKATLLVFLFIAFLSGCSSADVGTSNASNTAAIDIDAAQPLAESTPHTAPASANSNSAASAKSLEMRAARPQQAAATKVSLIKAEESFSAGRKIIRNAELNLEAEDPEDAQRRITAVAELRGGFVVDSQQSSSEIKSTTRDIVTMTVRIPSDRFNDTLADIRNVSTRVVVETVKGQDVTEEFIDIEAQLRAKKALEAQFMEIMKRANSVVDALDVQSQLADVRGEIERIEGRKRFLENQSAMSTIKVRLQTAKVFAATRAGFGGRLADSVGTGADVAIGFVLGLVTFVIAILPLAFVVGLPAFVFFRYVWKRHAHTNLISE